MHGGAKTLDSRTAIDKNLRFESTRYVLVTLRCKSSFSELTLYSWQNQLQFAPCVRKE